MYLARHIEKKVELLSQHFKVILVTGARQVGKSTMLSHIFPKLKNIIFDPVQDLYGARSDPDLFLQNFASPIILDEIQYAPELLPAIKRVVDQADKKGQYFLTGSQNLNVLKTVSESMAGRVGIIHLDGMTPYEKSQKTSLQEHWLYHYLKDPLSLIQQFTKGGDVQLFEALWRGNLPGLLEFPNTLVPTYFSSYIQTYLERDVRLLENIKDLNEFDRFLGLSAALTAQEINYSQLGREIGISPHTAERWLALLQSTYQWRAVLPYSGNTIKRLTKKPKGYITDTGIACYLQRVSSPEALARHPLLGALFETFVVNLIFSLSNDLEMSPQFYHWRTGGRAEVDLILEKDGALYPVEIKCKTVLSKKDLSGIYAFKETYSSNNIMPALVIYAGKDCYQIDKDIIALPWHTL